MFVSAFASLVFQEEFIKPSEGSEPSEGLTPLHLIFQVAQDERTQIYLDILSELEEEGKERMADEVILKLIDRMPPERFERLLLNLPVEKLLRTLSRLPAEQLQVLLAGIPKEQLQQALARTSGGTTSND